MKREIGNAKDPNAVAVYKEDSIVGHVPRNLAPRFFHFLSRDTCKAFVEVTGTELTEEQDMGWKSLVLTVCMVLQHT